MFVLTSQIISLSLNSFFFFLYSKERGYVGAFLFVKNLESEALREINKGGKINAVNTETIESVAVS